MEIWTSKLKLVETHFKIIKNALLETLLIVPLTVIKAGTPTQQARQAKDRLCSSPFAKKYLQSD